MKPAEEHRVTVRTLLSYGIGDVYGGGSFLIIGMLFLFYLTEVAGLSPAAASMVFAIGKVWDAVSDPLMGYLSDMTRSRHGRRRVYFLVGIVPVFVSFFLLWLPVSFTAQAAVFIYYSIAYLFFSTVFTMVMVPYAALNAELTPDFRQRSRLSAARMIFSGISALLAGTIPSIVIGRYPEGASQGYVAMAIIFGILYSIPWVLVYLGTWELPYAGGVQRSSGTAIFRQFASIMRNRSFRIHVSIYISAYTASDILMALFVYFLTYYLQRPELYAVAMGSLLVVQIAMMPVYTMISNRRGKGFAYVVGMVMCSIGLSASFLFLSPVSSTITIAVVCALIGSGTSAGILIPWAILPSVIDVDELITGRKRSGIYAGAMTLIRKMIQGLIVMPLIGFVLTRIGFVSNQVQSLQTQEALRLFFLLGPIVLIILGIISGLRFRITPQRHAQIIGEMKRLEAGGSREDVDPEVRKTCELLTGIGYERLYLRQEEIIP